MKSCTKGTVVRLSQQRERRILDWRLFWSWNGWFLHVQSEKNVIWGTFWPLYKSKLRVNRLRVIRIHKVCESMRFDSGQEVFVRVNWNYMLTEYVLNENDCTNVRIDWSYEDTQRQIATRSLEGKTFAIVICICSSSDYSKNNRSILLTPISFFFCIFF